MIDDFATREVAEGVHKEILYLQNCHFFQRCKGMEEVRSDSVYWLTHEPAGTKYLKILKHSINSLLSRLPNIQRFTHFQVSRFPKNGFGFCVHVDDPENSGCVVAVTYFSNQGYDRCRDGGVRRIFVPASRAVVDVEPVFNRLLVHWADNRVAHGTCKCFTELYSLSAWYFES